MSLDRTQTFFHQYANDFDAIYGNQNGPIDRVINRLFRKSMRLRFEKSIAGCNPIEGKSVLDVGCGPGHYSITLAQRGAARVVGVDFAEGMLRLATEHSKQVGVGDRCKFMVADFYQYVRDSGPIVRPERYRRETGAVEQRRLRVGLPGIAGNLRIGNGL